MLTQNKSNIMLKHAVETAHKMKLSVSISIVDAGGHLITFLRMDSAPIGTIDVAIRKAKTVAYFPISTENLGEVCRDQQLDGMLSTNNGMIGFAGGIPLMTDSGCIGAIGVSGASAKEDQLIAQKSAAALYIK